MCVHDIKYSREIDSETHRTYRACDEVDLFRIDGRRVGAGVRARRRLGALTSRHDRQPDGWSLRMTKILKYEKCDAEVRKEKAHGHTCGRSAGVGGPRGRRGW
jgi:hypothetical protein